MTKVVFETSTIADVIKKAARVAPGKGSAFDKAAGVVLDVSPESGTIVVRSTNLDIFYMEWTDCVSAEGESVSWRVPSNLLAGVVGSLPIGSGKTVTFEDKYEDNGVARSLHMVSGRTKSKFHMMDGQYFPSWPAFDPDGLTPVADLGGRITQVEWAASKNVADAPLSGVHLDGEYAYATDRYRLCRVPCPIEDFPEKGITVPARVLSGVLKQTGEVSIGYGENQLFLLPDEHTQIRTVTFAADYPNMTRLLTQDMPTSMKFKKSELVSLIGRAMNFAGSDRMPTLRLIIGKEEVAVFMQNQDIGLLGDVMELDGQCSHPRIEHKFNPDNILDALNNSPNEEVTIGYHPDRADKVMYLDGGSGYVALIMPRQDKPQGDKA